MSATAARRLPVSSGADDLGVLVALGLATVLATVWAVIAGGWNDGMSIALATTTAAVLEASLLAASTASRLVAGIAAPILGILVIVPLTLSSVPDAAVGESGVRHLAGFYSRAFASGILSSESASFVVGLCGGLWLLGFWTAWLAVRERQGILAVVPCYVVLAANALNAPSLREVALPEALALTASLLLLARAHLAALGSSWRRQKVVALPGTRRRYTATATAAVVGVVLLGVVAPPLSQTDLSSRIFHFSVGDLSPSGGGQGSGGGGAGGPASISFSPDTRPGGPLLDRPRPVLSYQADTADTVYLRDVTDVRFDAGNWTPALEGGRLRVSPVSVGSDPESQRIARDHDARHSGDAVDAALNRQVRIRFTLSASAASGSDDHALFAGDPEAVGRSGQAFGVGGTPVYGVGSGLLTVDFVRLARGYTTEAALESVATISQATETQLRSAGSAYPLWLSQQGYLQTTTPTDTGNDRAQLSDIRILAEGWTADATTPYDRARAVESRLRSLRYTLTPEQGPANEWPIHHFLFRSQAAYCQYFASSMGTMLRLLGIPARLVSGYGPGNLDDSSRGSISGLHTVSTSDAHDWVEAYFPGYGWIPFEPTPPSAQGTYEPFQRPTTSPGAVPTPSASAPTPRPTPTPQPTPAVVAPVAPQTPTPGPPRPLLGGVLGILLVVGLVAVAMLWLSRPGDTRGLWLRLILVARLLGVRRRRSDTQAGLAARVAAVLPPDGSSLLHPHGALGVGGRYRRGRCVAALALVANAAAEASFSRRGLDPRQEVLWRRHWSRLCRAVPGLLWRRLLTGMPRLRRGSAEAAARGRPLD